MKTEQAIERIQRIPRLVIGRDSMYAFDGLSCDDTFRDRFGKTWVWNGTSLRFAKPDGSPDYSVPPHPQFTDVQGFNDFAQRVNHLANNPDDLKA